MKQEVFTPVVDAEEVYGEGDWRPLLGAAPRKDDWKLHMIGKQSIEQGMQGIIFPSFDFTLQLADDSFRSSVAPCWTNTPDTKLPRHFTPNAFALPILMYPYLGEKKEHWVSPLNRRNMIGNTELDPEDSADAFDDLNKWVRRNRQISDEDKDKLLKTKTMKEDPPVPGRRLSYFSLGACKDRENDWHPALLGYTGSAYSYLIEQMRWRHEDGDPIDPSLPRYLLGDPTRPEAALVFHVNKLRLDAKDAHETNVLCYTRRREFLDDPVLTREVSPEMLAKRFLLPDPANWNIPTYESQVEHMISSFDPRVTIDMIRAACEHRYRGNIPTERPKSVTYSVGTSSEEPGKGESKRSSRADVRTTEPEGDVMAAATGGGSLAPKSSGPPPMPEPEPEAPRPNPGQTVNTSTYWTGKPAAEGQPKQDPVKMTVTQLQEMYDSGQSAGVKVMLPDNTWPLLDVSGLINVKPAVPDDAPPSIPQDDAPPAVPSADAAPAVPAGDPAPAGDGSRTRSDMKVTLFPDAAAFAALPAERQKEAESIIDEAYAATDNGRHQDLPPGVIDKLLTFIG
tara:strand:- start:2312 stop:4009 length:1698 start_codon:yes stop_codon:yes gene_type:complete